MGHARTPIGGHARFLPPKAGDDGRLHLTGLVARADGSFLLKRSLHGLASDAARLGAELGKLAPCRLPARYLRLTGLGAQVLHGASSSPGHTRPPRTLLFASRPAAGSP